MLMIHGSTLLIGVLAATTPAPRFAVLLEDLGSGSPAAAALEAALQAQGLQVVDGATAARLRKVVTPKAVREARLVDGPSVFETDAVITGAATYADPAPVDEGVLSQTVVLTIRLVDLATGRTTLTTQAQGTAVGAVRATLRANAAKRAVKRLMGEAPMQEALARVGPSGGSLTLVVRGLPHREALIELRQGLEKALAGAPAKEVYFAEGIGKIMLGGARSPTAMTGPDVADLLGQYRALGLEVVEVANTRIVARYDRSRAVRVHALVLEPNLGPSERRQAAMLGKYVATQLATYDFARASYQRGRISRKRALKRAKRIGADVVVESELLSLGRSSALVMRVIDVETGRPLLRLQRVVKPAAGRLEAAKDLLAELGQDLPETLAGRMGSSSPSRRDTLPAVARPRPLNKP